MKNLKGRKIVFHRQRKSGLCQARSTFILDNGFIFQIWNNHLITGSLVIDMDLLKAIKKFEQETGIKVK